jgi:hypothetical protein
MIGSWKGEREDPAGGMVGLFFHDAICGITWCSNHWFTQLTVVHLSRTWQLKFMYGWRIFCPTHSFFCGITTKVTLTLTGNGTCSLQPGNQKTKYLFKVQTVINEILDFMTNVCWVKSVPQATD